MLVGKGLVRDQNLKFFILIMVHSPCNKLTSQEMIFSKGKLCRQMSWKRLQASLHYLQVSWLNLMTAFHRWRALINLLTHLLSFPSSFSPRRSKSQQLVSKCQLMSLLTRLSLLSNLISSTTTLNLNQIAISSKLSCDFRSIRKKISNSLNVLSRERLIKLDKMDFVLPRLKKLNHLVYKMKESE